MAFTVAIDGPAAAGKGTIARAVAAEFGFAHLDTGLLYRAVGARVLAGEEAVAAARSLDPATLEDADLRSQAVAEAASRVAVIPEVRAALVDFQRRFARRDGGAVLDGRDIGTVIAPDADAKLWVDASMEERARRRFLELSGNGEDVTQDGVLQQLKERDARDSQRKDAPMKPADDAIWIDTTRLTPDECLAKAVEIVDARKAAPKEVKAPVKKPKA